MEKVKVNKNIFEALNEANNYYSDLMGKERKNAILCHSIRGNWANEVSILQDIKFVDLCEMMILGYELEETPHEKLLREFKDYNDDLRFGIIRALDILG